MSKIIKVDVFVIVCSFFEETFARRDTGFVREGINISEKVYFTIF